MERLDDDELRRWLREDAPHRDLLVSSAHYFAPPADVKV